MFCTLDSIPLFIKVEQIFSFIEYILDYILRSVGFSLKKGDLARLFTWLSEKASSFGAVVRS